MSIFGDLEKDMIVESIQDYYEKNKDDESISDICGSVLNAVAYGINSITADYSEEINDKMSKKIDVCHCENPVDTTDPGCITFGLCKEHAEES